jgi:hypothetical protein
VADCTYSEDLNLSLLDLFRDYLDPNRIDKVNQHQNSANKLQSKLWKCRADESEEGYIKFLPLELLQQGIRFVLIICTIRNYETFQHFLYHLGKCSETLQYADLTQQVKDLSRLFADKSKVVSASTCRIRSEESEKGGEGISYFDYFPSFYYENYSDKNFRMICISSTNSHTCS